MAILVLSDIHANLTALNAVINDAGPIDAVWCLGDIVGYGPDPNECIALVRGLPNLVCLLGNHDAAALGQIDVESFNLEARISVRWMQENLSEESIAFLKDLPESMVIDDVTLTHGSPRNPVWEYILDTRVARYNFAHLETSYCFVGHTHLPSIYLNANGHSGVNFLTPETGKKIMLEPRAILNPGSVGQPRDRDPRASYAIYRPEESSWEYHRVSYPIGEVQQRIYDAGLPQRHGLRLSEGW